VQTHFPTTEICNGIDDDCDGAIDEENPPGGAPCTVPDALGACAAGTNSCASGTMTCVPTTTASTEVCNGVDDDCDGQTDEGLAPLTCGLGVCASTVPACVGGVPQTCVPGSPSTEICNGLDDDCDGRTDEEYAWSGLLQPVNQDGSSIFQQKSTIPLKFRLTSCSGAAITTAVATLEVVPFSDAIVGTVDEGTLPNARADTGSLFRFDAKAGQYMFNLGTKSLVPSAAYTLRIRIDDGSVHDTVISLK
jgi:putative metal-binding protein